MRRFILLMLLAFGAGHLCYGQSQEVQQLLLNVEKLSQLKNILKDMKIGYEVVSKGYGAVKNIAEGNFSLHETFLDAMMLVSPQVRKYHKIADIITVQTELVREYKSAFKRFSLAGNFSIAELEYLGKVYGQLFSQSLDNLDQLTIVITAGKLRMTDDERLQVIDGVFEDVQEKLTLLRLFNRETSMLNLQREKEKLEVSGAKRLYNLN